MLSREEIIEMLGPKKKPKARAAPQDFTIPELADILKLGESAVRSRVRDLVRRGQAEKVGTATRPRIDGRTYECPIYRLTKPKRGSSPSSHKKPKAKEALREKVAQKTGPLLGRNLSRRPNIPHTTD